MKNSRDKIKYKPINEELANEDLININGGDCAGDVAFWVGLGLSVIPGGTLVGQLIAVASYACENDMNSSSHNYAKSY